MNALLLGEGEGTAAAAVLACLIVGTILVTLASVILRYAVRPATTRPGRPADARPPDGRVELAALCDVQKAPNPADPRIGRLAARSPDDGPGSLVAPVSGVPTLLGRVVVFSIFIGRDGRAWSDAEIAEAYRSMIRAGTWIENEAMRFDAPVNIDLADAYLALRDDAPRRPRALKIDPDGDPIAPFDAFEDVELISAISREVAGAGLGFNDVAELIAWMDRRVEADRRCWLVHSRSAGQSMAVPVAALGTAGSNLAVCYAYEDDLPGPLKGPPFADPVTFVHELLHLFGASDKYGVPLDRFPAGSVTRKDVMVLDETRLNRLRVDPLTARELGWGEPKPEPPGRPKHNARRDRGERPPRA
jgi:hypothetical protein